MLAISIREFGGPEVLTPIDVPRPEPGAGDVLIRVKAAGVARADAAQRAGKYPPPAGASDIPGLDVAGIIESVGCAVTQFHSGQEVCAILTGGGYAEFCVAPVEQVLPKPANWTFVEAATLPENLFTAYDNVVTRAHLRRGETILVHGGTSGVGSLAIMLARALGCNAIATAGSDDKCRACEHFGAAHAINYKRADFVAEVNRLTAGRGVDVVLDMVGGSYLSRNLECLAADGRIVIIASWAGARAELDIAKLMQRRASVMGSTLRARPPRLKGEIRDRLLAEVWPLLPAKEFIRPLVDSTYPLRNAAEAHKRLETSEHVGKLILVT